MTTFRDWAVGCDNTLSCMAESLAPDGAAASDIVYVIGVRRDAGPTAGVEIWFPDEDKSPKALRDFVVDGRNVASAPVEQGAATVRGAQAIALAAAIARGTTMDVKAGEKVLGRPSLAGASAAMRYIDDRQGRDGTTTALVATGTRAANTVKAAPPAPIINRVTPDASLKAQPLSDEENANALKVSGCGTMDVTRGDGIEVDALSPTQALVLATCGSGPYNSNSEVLIATGAAGRRTFVRATFDYEPGYGTAGSAPVLVNGGWDAQGGRLYGTVRGRALSDCGHSQSYVWDGAMFRLVEMQVMNECRGARDWIPVWRAAARP